MRLKQIFEKTVQFFKDKKIESARLDAELLISHVLKIERLQIYLKYEQPLSETEIQALREVVGRRGRGEPVAYITGSKGFYGQDFAVGEGVLIPRPETELIVEEALAFIKDIPNPKILDLGAGSGCIGFSILKNHPCATLTSVEKSEKAFRYLKKNQEALGLQQTAQLLNKDVVAFDPQDQLFDVIVANPPYIAENDPATETNVKKFEPAEALFSAHEGYGDIYAWSKLLTKSLKNPGLMLFEIGHTQGAKTKQHFESLGGFTKVEILKDLAGLDRTLKALNNG